MSVGTYTSEEPMDVDINNNPNETLFGVTDTGNGITVPLHGVTDLNSLDHSYSRQTNDSLNGNDIITLPLKMKKMQSKGCFS